MILKDFIRNFILKKNVNDVPHNSVKYNMQSDNIESKAHIKINVQEYNPILRDSISTVIENGFASTSLLQNKYHLSYAKSAKIIDTLENIGVVGPYRGSAPRKVLVNKSFLNNLSIEVDESKCISDTTDCFQKHDNTEQSTTISTIEEILNRIDKMSENGWEFEKFVANLLLKNGFSSAEVTSGSNDYGVDVIAVNPLGVRHAIQCKCYSSKLSNKPVQEIIAGKAIYNCQVGIVITNNFFTDNAIKVAEANNILLWNRYKLIEFIYNAINDISTILPEE